MKIKIKSIFGICIAICMLLGVSYYTFAADNLKNLQDKYRTSYNNFMKALKEGADQEQIDKISEQCKIDYAEYQKALNKNVTSNNKPLKPTSTSSSKKTNSNVSSQNTYDYVTKLLNQNKQPKYKKIKIDGKYYDIEICEHPNPSNFFKQAIKRPSAPLNPKRINESIDEPLTYIEPEFTQAPLDDDEKDGREKIDKLYNKIKLIEQLSSDYAHNGGAINTLYDEVMMNDAPSIYRSSKYAPYPSICGYAKLLMKQLDFIGEGRSSVYPNSKTALAFQEIVDNYKFQKDASCQNIVKYAQSHLTEIKNNCKILENQNNDLIYKITQTKNKIEELKTKTYELSTKPSQAQVNGYYSDVLNSYRLLFENYSKTNDYKASSVLIDGFKKYYQSSSFVPFECNIKYNDANGKLQTETFYPTKDPVPYLSTLDTYKLICIKNSELTSEDSESIFNKVKDELIPQIKEYTISNGNATTNIAPEKNDDATLYNISSIQNSADNRGIYTRKSKITEMHFNIESIPIAANAIILPEQIVTLIAETDYMLPGVSVSFDVEVKSKVSNRSKKIQLKRSRFNTQNYYATFQPNETDDSSNKINNLINNSTKDDKLQHSVCIADGVVQYLQENSFYKNNPFSKIRSSDYFKNSLLGEGLTRKRKVDPDDTVIINDNFMDALGFETISVELTDNSKKIITHVQNQANWVILNCHGDQFNGILGTALYQTETSIQFFDAQNINYKNTNLHFLVLSSCGALNIVNQIDPEDLKSTSGIIWRNLFGEKVALLGYTQTIRGNACASGLINLVDYLENEFSSFAYTLDFKSTIIRYWLLIHEEIYKNAIKSEDKHKIWLNRAAIYAAGVLGKYHYSLLPDKKSGTCFAGNLKVYKEFISWQQDISSNLNN